MTMILRNITVRHGRKALAVPIRKAYLRSLTTGTLQQGREAVESSIHNHSLQTHSIKASINQLQATDSLLPSADDSSSDQQIWQNHQLSRHIRARTRRLGAVVEPHYRPHELVVNPPKPEDVTLELLMASQSHLGHSTSLWNPMNQRYIFGIRQGIHIISLETTAAHLRRAAKVVEGVAYHGGLILFVGTRDGQGPCVVKAAELAKGCHLFQKWIPGTITNGDQILAKCGIKALDKDDTEVDGFQEKIVNWKALRPDLVVVLNPTENYILLHECGLNNIPTIGIIDTDADPSWVTYPIPANDDSLRCVQVIAGVLGRAGQSGQEKRLKAAQTGQVTWQPPVGLGSPFEEERARAKKVEEEQKAKCAEQAERAKKFLGIKDDEDPGTHTRGSQPRGRIDEEDEEDL